MSYAYSSFGAAQLGNVKFNQTLDFQHSGFQLKQKGSDFLSVVENPQGSDFHQSSAIGLADKTVDLSLHGDLSVSADLNVGAALSVAAASELVGDVTAKAALTVEGAAAFQAAVTAQANLGVTGDAIFDGRITANDAVACKDTLVVDLTADITGAVTAHDNLSVLKDLSVTQDSALGGALAVDGASLFKSAVTIGEAATHADVTIYGNLTIEGTQTAVNSTDLLIEDQTITIGVGATTVQDITANCLGLHFGQGALEAKLCYDGAEFEFTHPLRLPAGSGLAVGGWAINEDAASGDLIMMKDGVAKFVLASE